MKVPPKKPHFFKPILPGFKNGLKIPIGFLKYLKKHNQYEHAILKRARKKWLVKVNDGLLEKGNWKEFVEEHDLQLGDLLVFKHEGDMKFEVFIFDSSHCNIQYEDEDEDEDEDEEVVTHDEPIGQPHFECIIRKYCLSRGFMYLPQQFTHANGLTNKKCGLIIRDERQRSWNLKLSSDTTRSRSYIIGDGWRKFAKENYLKEGDRVMFKILTNGETPIWKFHGEKSSPNIVQSHFECTITQDCLSRDRLYVPNQFAFVNGLIDKKSCDLIIRDERQRSWNFNFLYRGNRVYIGDGWHKFVINNCLKKGDQILFEVFTNGKTPIWKFQVVTNGKTPMHKLKDIMKKPSNMSPLNAQVSNSIAGDDGHPYFVSTIKPYCMRKSILYLPLDFAKSNGLMNRNCEMILKDEAQRCWSVRLGRDSNHFGIRNGWAKFRAKNGLQVGDAYKFELIKNGKIPIAKFHCKFSEKIAKRVEH